MLQCHRVSVFPLGKMATVREYFADKNVFLTGGTGFLGKVLIEKLLRCCPEIKAIYCLTRPKKGKHAQDRIRGIFADMVCVIFNFNRKTLVFRLVV